KELLAACLEPQARVYHSRGTRNSRRHSATERSILRVRPWHRFAIIEVGIQEKGNMTDESRLLRPDVVVMLNVRRLHFGEFKSLDAIAEEKSTLIRNLGPDNLAIINADDPRVAAMESELQCRVIRFGTDEAADVAVTYRNVAAAWPDRLAMTVVADDRPHAVKTALVGKHWANSVVAALTAAQALGVPVTEAVPAIRTVPPFWLRMQPVELRDRGVTFLRDEFNGSIDTYEPAFEVLGEATAVRKVVLFSDMSDTNRSDRKRGRLLGRRAAELAGLAVFVGNSAHHAAAAAIHHGLPEDKVAAFDSAVEAGTFLDQALQPGDLVLMKGRTSNHVSRAYLNLLDEVTCVKDPCSFRISCDECPELGFAWRPELADYMVTPNQM
ncbi:MAG: Mur ligase family protein, partial [Acidimicrobiia bacterium]